jgi:hypothetical protein
LAPKNNYFGEKCALENNDMGPKINIHCEKVDIGNYFVEMQIGHQNDATL